MDPHQRLRDRYADPVLSCSASLEWENRILGDEPDEAWAAMRRAGQAIAAAVQDDLKEQSKPPTARAIGLIGKGHNGGDALIALEALLHRFPDWRVRLVLTAGTRSLRPLTRRALEDLLRHHSNRCELLVWREGSADGSAGFLSREPADLCLDGLLGMQFRPPLRAAARQIIACVNGNPRIGLRAAVDLPSGVGDRSDPEPFRADFTYATGMVKAPVADETNRGSVGRFRYLDLGFFAGSKPDAGQWVLKDSILDPLRGLRLPGTDKRSFGHVYVLAGSRSYPGALLMSVRAALQAGAGLVTAFAPESLSASMATHAPEAIWVPWPETLAGSLALEGRHLLRARADRCSSLVMGPGIGREAETLEALGEADGMLDVPVLVDADALQPELVQRLAERKDRSHPMVLTPHHGEFRRIAGEEPTDKSLCRFSARTGAVTVLKGPVTRISDGRCLYLSPFGGPALARGGSGDLLAGVMGTTLAGCPESTLEAACRAVVWHGRAADQLARSRGQVAVSTTEILPCLGVALRDVSHEH